MDVWNGWVTDTSVLGFAPTLRFLWSRRLCRLYSNNNDYGLERLTRTGLKRLHVLYKYTLSKFNANNIDTRDRDTCQLSEWCA